MISILGRVALCWLMGVLSATAALAQQYQAVSLRETRAQIAAGGGEQGAIRSLAGITRPLVCVFDETTSDLIIVGECERDAKPLQIDDLVVAMRAVIKHKAAPLVSIDPPAPYTKTGDQPVRFAGHVEDTQFGQDLLAADIVLKKLGLGKISAEVWGVRSYFDLSADEWKHTGAEDGLMSRFWFVVDEQASAVAARKGIGLLKRLKIRVQTEVSATIESAPPQDARSPRDAVGDAFASSLTSNLDDLMVAMPELQRLDQLYRLVGIASVIDMWQERFGVSVDCLDFWLTEYAITQVDTPRTYKLVSSSTNARDGNATMTISGGIELQALITDARSGSLSAIRDLILKSRPQQNSLSWAVPFGDSLSELTTDTAVIPALAPPVSSGAGMNLRKDFSPWGGSAVATWTPPRVSSLDRLANFRVTESYTPVQQGHRIGGVMLNGTAQVANDGAPISLASGTFGLVVDGDNATYDLRTYQRFVTAVWAVYYCKQPPGISIDPVARGAEKQLVRYIGRVINTDLGRVMREADYTMKKWAIGAERPDVPDFKDVDQLTASQGLNLLGASRRFWFVPEDIRFSRGDGLLVFESGRMRLRTEYNEDGIRHKAEPVDERFAEFFTDNYATIAKQYPIFDELFEYAKMVALARYLKEQGVPLHWFLLANRDLVLTENSPGTVDTLARGSQAIEGMRIEGGVEMGIKGQYVFDAAATKAVAKAFTQARATEPGVPTPSPNPEVIVPATAVPRANPVYSLVPQSSLTSGRDRKGLRYQTDIALRAGSEPGLELVRYFRNYSEGAGEFGRGWHMLVPYRITPADAARRPFLNVMAPVRMNVTNLLSGRQETLTLDEERYTIAGYVPQDLGATQVVGLFPLTNATFRLADKLGNQLQFDEAGCLTDMFLGPEYHVHYGWARGPTEAIARPGIQLKGIGQRVVTLGDLHVPDSVALVDAAGNVGETLMLSDDEGVLGYLPERDQRESSRIRIVALRKDGTFELLNQDGHQAVFTAAGNLERLVIAAESPIPSEVNCGEQKAVFSYSLDVTGTVRVGAAMVTWPHHNYALRIRYQYDAYGNLANVAKSEVDRP
jgi:hypothetical protein